MKDLTQINARAMQVFLTILVEGNLSEVARRERLAPSSVTRILQQLEQTLGTQLLYRNTRAVTPTEDGRIYGETFRQILQQLKDTQSLVEDRRQIPGGLLRLNTPVSFGQRHISPWLAELSGLYPALNIELTLTDAFVDPLSDAADLLLRISPLKDSALHGRFIDTPVFHLAASPAYLEKNGEPLLPDDLRRHHLLVYKGVMGLQRWAFTRNGEKTQIVPESKLASNNAEMLVRAAIDGAGIVLFPDWQIGELLRNGQLISLMMDFEISSGSPEQSIYLLYPGTRYQSLNTRTVIDFFLGKFGQPPYWKYRNPARARGC